MLSKLTDILDRQHPTVNLEIDVESSDSEMEMEQDYEGNSNANYQKAEQELKLLEQFKRKKYRPEFDESNSRVY